MTPSSRLSPVIRDMRAEDRAAVAELLLDLNRVEDAITGDRHVTEEAGWACLVDNEAWIAEHGGAVMVAIVDNNVVGALALCFDVAEPFIRPDVRRHALVADLVVARHARGRGVGRLLLAEAERRAKAAGLPAMTIGALVGNEPALRLYDDFGFQRQTIEFIKWL